MPARSRGRANQRRVARGSGGAELRRGPLQRAAADSGAAAAAALPQNQAGGYLRAGTGGYTGFCHQCRAH